MRFLSLACLFLATIAYSAEPARARKVVLIAGPMDGGHPAGTHEYEKTVRVFKYCLENAANVKGIRVEAHLGGWPEKASTLDDADTIVFVSSGSDRKEADHPILIGDRLAVLEKQMKRGCGLAMIHWSTFTPKRTGSNILEWVGGYFDYESGPAKNGWYSKIQTVTVKAVPGRHPITSGMSPFEAKDEFYYNLRFRERDPRLVPILSVPMGKEGEHVVAWAVERASGGRGFGFTGGHFFDNWKDENYRRMALNAILWTAHVDVPEGGVKSEFPGTRELGLVPVGTQSQVLILTGHDGPFHNWRETSQTLKHVIEREGRLKCRIVDDPEFLAREDLLAYDLIVQNYVNWERGGLSDTAKRNLLKYLEAGHGLAVIHFANGAFHPSLPKAGESDWPEYRKIVRRVWDHKAGLSGHDAYKKFRVDISTNKHPITDGMTSFETIDELYYRQQGDEPINVLVTAKSKDTGKDEPLAWTYQYGKARVFQTLLGHSADSIRGEGAAQLIRRGAAWAAGRELKSASVTPVVKEPEKKLTYAEGKFGKALDARVASASIEGDDRFRKAPLTVECWAKLLSKTNFNILVSCDPKSSGQHWELYSYAGSGVLSAYLPGTTIGEIRSATNICDGQWHHVALTHDGKTVRLYVDGKQVESAAVKYRADAGSVPGPLMIGAAYADDHRIGCDGFVDEVRISSQVRAITAIPTAAPTRDASTISLWNLNGDEGISADTNWTPPTPEGPAPAWQKMTDKDWVDGRFQKTDTGPYLNATFDYEGPTGKVRAYKGTSIRLGEKQQGAVLFDRTQLRYAASWTGDYLNHSSRRFGLLNTPTPAGQMAFGSSALAGWADKKGSFETKYPLTTGLPSEWAHFKGLYLNGQRTTLSYTVHGVEVLDSPWYEPLRDGSHFTRTIEVAPTSVPLKMLVGEFRGFGPNLEIAESLVLSTTQGRQEVGLTKTGDGKLSLEKGGRVAIKLAPSKAPQQVKVSIAVGRKIDIAALLELSGDAKVGTLKPLVQAGSTRWNKSVTTQLELGTATDKPLVIDTLNLPYENPWNALFFVTGVDFLPDGRIAICTAHGDVWTVKDGGAKAGTLIWKRFATGLYQPLGLKVVEGNIVVVERGQLTRLHDTNNDGEADFYENLNSDWHAGGGEHSYDTCLETDPQGNFYFFKTGDDHTPTGGCLLKVSKDGSKMEVFSTGFRHPIGLGMSPTGVISGADQEGNWMPVTRLDLYKKGGFYGDMRTHHRQVPPTIYDEPLLWIPKDVDNSAGGQAWVPEGKWGGLGGKMIHLSYGWCKPYAILFDGEKFQAGIVDLDLQFLSGSARGRFRDDGQMYVVGLNGWQTAAKKDGSLQRVRYTGKPFNGPTSFAVEPTGIRLGFDQKLDASTIADLTRFSIERWNYRWSGDYGSKHWKVSNPNVMGHDPVPLQAATLSPDGKSLFLKVADIQPAMQMKISYAVKSMAGKELEGSVHTTIHGPTK